MLSETNKKLKRKNLQENAASFDWKDLSDEQVNQLANLAYESVTDAGEDPSNLKVAIEVMKDFLDDIPGLELDDEARENSFHRILTAYEKLLGPATEEEELGFYHDSPSFQLAKIAKQVAIKRGVPLDDLDKIEDIVVELLTDKVDNDVIDTLKFSVMDLYDELGFASRSNNDK